MIAIVKEKAGPGFVIKEVDVPKYKANEVLIKVECIGICGSDIPIFNGIRNVPIPFIAGHEFTGVIVEVGSEVKKYKKGDRVVPSSVQNCFTCSYCREGYEVLCDELVETGIHVNGSFAEYVVVPENSVHKLPDNVSFLEGSMVDPIASAHRPVKKASVTPEDTVVVFGPGPIGLLSLQVAKLEGANKVIMVGTRENRLNLAKELGADITVNIGEKGEDAVEKIKEYTNGKMADIIIEATGKASVVETCINSLKKKGHLSLAGIFHEPCTIPVTTIVRNELTIEGSICYSYNDFEHCIDLLSSRRIDVKKMITHELPLKDIKKALELIDKREAIKVVLYP
ncbi:MAG: alcohol dehydrogenase catalytic domain-containing protein [Clostridia bacterium]|nr:alcohol dehydrogenase catalytic domain-containing protein [Clostridia bacterium]